MSENFEIIGIGKTAEQAALDPRKSLEMTRMELVGTTNGKLFLALRDYDPDTNNAIRMKFNGYLVKIKDNESTMFTNSEQQKPGRYLPYPFDIPMRFLEDIVPPQTFTIQFETGTYESNNFIRTGTSEIFHLTITQI
ncbi:MAG TPA: hypothetical protein PK024_04585 [Methanospirillum sp.]|mgnify:CR=1 FL=1|uniref:hypothetical protein n=1 Tax=Methanospirillum sp. TaxID=45200 RepID=UPI002BA003F1|nr:hypothetical protein [Methanospirillum sp.]HOJ96101.1 hypothetical protein [Methanospirillum sp.]HPP76774.1 hypothetical protein [Methanospirillum sp.]